MTFDGVSKLRVESLRPKRRRRGAGGVALAAAALALGACGGGDDGGGGGGREKGSSKDAAERLCQTYRTAVTDVRYTAREPRGRARDFRNAERAARAVRRGTSAGELDAAGPDYLRLLDTVAGAYRAAATAAGRNDQTGLGRALDIAEPGDEALDTAADRAGLTECSLDEPRPGRESRVSQSGFPALLVPKGPRVPPNSEETAQAYPIDARNQEAIVLVRGPRLSTGRIPVEQAAERFETDPLEGQKIEPAGESGDEQVPMRRFRYTSAQDRGTIHVFSGQGNLWLISCSSRLPDGPSPALNDACDRAAQTAGFLMF